MNKTAKVVENYFLSDAKSVSSDEKSDFCRTRNSFAGRE